MRLCLLTLLLAACDPKGSDTDPTRCEPFTHYRDADSDGYGDPDSPFETCNEARGVLDATDCDDGDSTTHPDADEECTGTIDANCDGSVGDADLDADGSPACEDCDDTDPLRSPDAGEFCNEVDDDCDGEVDDHPVDGTYYYADADADGYGNGDWYVRTCTQPEGWTEDLTDCNDTDATVNLGADEICDGQDNDCDGNEDDADAVDAPTWYDDNDEDGYGNPLRGSVSCRAPSGYVAEGTDCDDRDAAINPDATEVCNGDDDDCDGGTDDAEAIDALTWYEDLDGDDHGDATSIVLACELPEGASGFDDDCDDADASAYPGADESCDDVDDDCDGIIDEDPIDAANWYTDADTDGYGDPSVYTTVCDAPAGTVALGTDCDDTDPDLSPDASETCDGVDQDCDGTVDEAATNASTWFRDSDGDSYGAAGVTRSSCGQPSGYVSDNTDCDDTDLAISPVGSELCNSVDDDCDGATDETSALDAPTWYEDADSDGYGDASVATASCSAPTGYVSEGTDCDDGDGAWHPHAPEADCADPNDYNCDGSTGSSDGDADGYAACEDCDDADDEVSPSAGEVCNGVDDDCDSSADEAGATGGTDWYADLDADTYGDASSSLNRCEAPAGYVAIDTDCDDADASINPGATETCATTGDDDCDGDDNDRNATDCIRYYWDYDEDGYGSTSNACYCEPTGYLTASNADDCDDGEAGASPAGTETWGNGLDDDCEGTTDVVTADEDEDAVYVGEDASDAAGSVLGAGDFNGDGYEDVFVAAAGADDGGSGSGVVYVAFGPPSGSADLSTADVRLVGVDPGDAVSTAISVDDLDGDGASDAVVSSYQAGSANTGVVYIVSGGVTGTLDLSTADTTLTGVTRNDYFGISVDTSGDLDGDGLRDVIVGASGRDTGGSASGSAYLFSGLATSTSASSAESELYGEDASDGAGAAVLVLGDVDGDGQDDVAVGADGDDDGGSAAGALYVVLGPFSASFDLSGADGKLVGEAAADAAGAYAAAPGDLDGDGLADAIVGAAGASPGGVVYGVYHPVGTVDLGDADVSFASTSVDTTFGSALGVGDFDGDGAVDLAVGHSGDDNGASNAGALYMYFGPFLGDIDVDDASSVFYGSGASDGFGGAIATGDTDGDGLPDLIVGAVGEDDGGSAAGAAWVYFGR